MESEFAVVAFLWKFENEESLRTMQVHVCTTLNTYVYKFLRKFLAGLQSNSGLWIDDVRLSVCLSVRLSVRPLTFWLISAFKFVLGHINQYRLDALHVYRPW